MKSLVDFSESKKLVVNLFFLVFFVGACFRTPAIFSEGRLWAEEGSVFLQSFLGFPLIHNLLFLHHGHLHLAANIVVAIAAGIPLDYAPLAMAWMGFSVQCAVVYLMLSRVYDFLGIYFVPMVALLFLGFPSTAELWANATNLQWHLALATALILVAPSPSISSFRGRFIICVLLVSGLTGVPSLFWTPLYIYKARREADVRRWQQSAVLIFAGIIQASLVLTHNFGDRSVGLAFGVFGAAISEQMIIAPLFGIPIANALADSFKTLVMGQDYSSVVLMVSCVGILLWGTYVAIFGGLESRILAIGSWFSLILGLNGSIGDKTALISGADGGRYFFAPFFALLLAQIIVAGSSLRAKRAVSCFLIICCMTVISVGYQSPGVFLQGESWRRQLELTRAESGAGVIKTLGIWPNGWVIHVDKKYLVKTK